MCWLSTAHHGREKADFLLQRKKDEKLCAAGASEDMLPPLAHDNAAAAGGGHAPDEAACSCLSSDGIRRRIPHCVRRVNMISTSQLPSSVSSGMHAEGGGAVASLRQQVQKQLLLQSAWGLDTLGALVRGVHEETLPFPEQTELYLGALRSTAIIACRDKQHERGVWKALKDRGLTRGAAVFDVHCEGFTAFQKAATSRGDRAAAASVAPPFADSHSMGKLRQRRQVGASKALQQQQPRGAEEAPCSSSCESRVSESEAEDDPRVALLEAAAEFLGLRRDGKQQSGMSRSCDDDKCRRMLREPLTEEGVLQLAQDLLAPISRGSREKVTDLCRRRSLSQEKGCRYGSCKDSRQAALVLSTEPLITKYKKARSLVWGREEEAELQRLTQLQQLRQPHSPSRSERLTRRFSCVKVALSLKRRQQADRRHCSACVPSIMEARSPDYQLPFVCSLDCQANTAPANKFEGRLFETAHRAARRQHFMSPHGVFQFRETQAFAYNETATERECEDETLEGGAVDLLSLPQGESKARNVVVGWKRDV
ncbi:hypothetical protein cyc_03578 [Cyclospora cayetanensis]|uniref:Uncharacterized protein n=1 Tax=Cyclospora cayetanensis TaxID=88456 RepID=A0A1D3D1X8_9EIME|nr:hypothetical protein cyc_03578 [Cyclospora cayetanensis]